MDVFFDFISMKIRRENYVSKERICLEFLESEEVIESLPPTF